MTFVGSSTQTVQLKEKTSHQLLVHLTYIFVGHTTYPWFEEKLVEIIRVFQNQLHLAGRSTWIQITSPLFAVWTHPLLKLSWLYKM